MKIFERILDNRIRQIVEITVNRAEFAKNSGVDAIYAARLSMEEHRPFYIAFLDLEKAFNRTPHKLIWQEPPSHHSSLFLLWDIQRPALYTLLHADNVFSENDLEQIVQKWNDLLMQRGLRLNLNKTQFQTTGPHETGTITSSGSDLRRLGDLNILAQYYQLMKNCVMKLLHALTQLG